MRSHDQTDEHHLVLGRSMSSHQELVFAINVVHFILQGATHLLPLFLAERGATRRDTYKRGSRADRGVYGTDIGRGKIITDVFRMRRGRHVFLDAFLDGRRHQTDLQPCRIRGGSRLSCLLR